MIARRFFSLVIDFLLSLLPAIASNIGGFNLAFAFLIIYLSSQVLELILLQGRTVGMVIFKIHPLNNNGKNPSILKLVLYHLVLTINVASNFFPLPNRLFRILFTLILSIPFYHKKNHNSVLDIIFRMHWGFDEIQKN